MSEENKQHLPAIVTPQTMVLAFTIEAKKCNLTIGGLQTRALSIVKNRDSLKIAADFLNDIKKLRGINEEVHKREKKPFLDNGRAVDHGKKLVGGELDR